MSTVLLGFTMAVMAEIMSISMISSTRLERQFDVQMASRSALDRIKKDVRMASAICPGHNPGSVVSRCSLTSPPVDPPIVPRPVLCNHGQNELILGPQTLILHLPNVFLEKANDPKDPLYVPDAPQSARNGVRIPGYETVIYKLVPDDTANKFKILMTVIPSPVTRLENCSYRDAITDSVVATGIVGPLNPSAGPGSTPEIFKYISKNPLVASIKKGRLDTLSQTALVTMSTQVLPDPEISEAISGVTLDCEFSRGSTIDDPASRVSAVHTEALLRLPLAPYGAPEGVYYE
ncbi:MAG: hypothetical protein SGJ27_13605 [Candidatus Melainabacteria bacterium]|nr:hypothetical protein [Candidatus Melainabacteria bacterium]